MKESFNIRIKSDTCLASPEFKGLRSARMSLPSTLKEGFDKFLMNRKDSKKRDSDFQEPQLSYRSKISNISDEDLEYQPQTSRLSINKELSQLRELSPAKKIKAFLLNGGRMSRGDTSERNPYNSKPKFSQFEENFKEKISLKSARYSHLKKGFSSDEASFNKNYFSLGKQESSVVEENDVDAKISQNEIEEKFDEFRNINNCINILSDLPEFLKEDFKSQLQILRKENSSLKYDIDILANQYDENKLHLEKTKYAESEMLRELKEIKNSRNKLISEKVVMANELDFIKSNPIVSKISTERIDPKILTTSSKEKVTLGSNNSQTQNSKNLQNDTLSTQAHLDNISIIDDLENKMSHFKLENSKFYESIDLLCDDLVESEEKNKNLKNQMKQLDKMIETLMKEKNSLKVTISKFNPTLADETSKKNNK